MRAITILVFIKIKKLSDCVYKYLYLKSYSLVTEWFSVNFVSVGTDWVLNKFRFFKVTFSFFNPSIKNKLKNMKPIIFLFTLILFVLLFKPSKSIKIHNSLLPNFKNYDTISAKKSNLINSFMDAKDTFFLQNFQLFYEDYLHFVKSKQIVHLRILQFLLA